MDLCLHCNSQIHSDKFYKKLKCGHVIHSMCLLLLSNYSLSCTKCKRNLVNGEKLTSEQEETQLFRHFNELCKHYIQNQTKKQFSEILHFVDTNFTLIMCYDDRFKRFLIAKYNSGWYFINDIYYNIYMENIF